VTLPERPRPDATDRAAREYWSALERGSLEFQRCSVCVAAWLPPQAECPNCLSPEWTWEEASGRGTVVASTVFHRAYHPAFESVVPYSVSLVRLEEGPRLLTNITGLPDGRAPDPGSAVELEIVRASGVPLAWFRLAA
jgi:uncharacterized OB-fold protein